mgnify:CR=1
MFYRNKIHLAALALVLAIIASIIPVQYLNESWEIPLGLGLFLGLCWFSFRLLSKSVRMDWGSDVVAVYDILMMFPVTFILVGVTGALILETSRPVLNSLGGISLVMILNQFARIVKYPG